MERTEWLKARKGGVGASEAPAILGICPFRTALEVYLDKVDLLPEKEPTRRMQWGLAFQRAIATCYELERGVKVAEPLQSVPLSRCGTGDRT